MLDFIEYDGKTVNPHKLSKCMKYFPYDKVTDTQIKFYNQTLLVNFAKP